MVVTFGTHYMKYHLFTLLVFHHFYHGVLIAWIIISRQKEDDQN